LLIQCILKPRHTWLGAVQVKTEAFASVHEALLRRYRNLQMHVAKAAAYARVFALSAHMWHSHEVERELGAVAGVGEVQVRAWPGRGEEGEWEGVWCVDGCGRAEADHSSFTDPCSWGMLMPCTATSYSHQG
jgi:hypothetical protein